MSGFRSRKSLLFLLPAAIAVLLATHALWLGALGKFLIAADQPAPADLAVVLAGDGYGHRILKAAELVREGYVPRVLVSGPAGYYGSHESDLAVTLAVKRGYPEDYFLKFPHEAHSTREETQVVAPELRRLGVHNILLVTSDYHTRRAGRIFRAGAPGIGVRVIAAPDEYYRWDHWWQDRDARKIFLLEWMKTFSSFAGM